MKKLILLMILVTISSYALCQQKTKVGITFKVGNTNDSAIVYLPYGYSVLNKYPLLLYAVGVKDTTDLYVPFFMLNKERIVAIPYPGDSFLNSKRKREFTNYVINNFAVDTMNMSFLQQ